MRLYVYISLCAFLISCNNIESNGNINVVPTKSGKTEITFHNNNTTSIRDIGIFLSVDELLQVSPIRLELKVTAPNMNYWIDTLVIKNSGGSMVSFSSRKELYCKAYKDICLMQGGDYKFTTRAIGISSELIYMIGVIIENKDSGKR